MTATPWTTWPQWLKWASGIVATVVGAFAAGAIAWAAHIDNEVDVLKVDSKANKVQHAADNKSTNALIKANSEAAKEMNAMIVDQIKSADNRAESRDKRAESQLGKVNNRLDHVYSEFNKIEAYIEREESRK